MVTGSEGSILLEVIKQQNETIAALKNTIEQMNADSKILHEQIDYLTKKLFGKKSEKTSAISGQITLDAVAFGQFDEAEVEANIEEVEQVISKRKPVLVILGKKLFLIYQKRTGFIHCLKKNKYALPMEMN